MAGGLGLRFVPRPGGGSRGDASVGYRTIQAGVSERLATGRYLGNAVKLIGLDAKTLGWLPEPEHWRRSQSCTNIHSDQPPRRLSRDSFLLPEPAIRLWQ